MPGQVNSETVDLIFDHVHDAPEKQLGDANALDAKMVQLFSAASIIIGLAGLSTLKDHPLSAALLIVALIAYIVFAIQAFQYLRVRGFYRSVQADKLWASGWDRSPEEVKRALIADVARAYAHNRSVLVEKGQSIQSVIRALAFEVVFVGAALVAIRL